MITEVLLGTGIVLFTTLVVRTVIAIKEVRELKSDLRFISQENNDLTELIAELRKENKYAKRSYKALNTRYENIKEELAQSVETVNKLND